MVIIFFSFTKSVSLAIQHPIFTKYKYIQRVWGLENRESERQMSLRAVIMMMQHLKIDFTGWKDVFSLIVRDFGSFLFSL